MIQFIELVPVFVKNENYALEHAEFLQREMSSVFAFPPDTHVIRHENKVIGMSVHANLELGEKILIDGNKFVVQTIGPKEFTLNGNWTQDIYVIRQ